MKLLNSHSYDLKNYADLGGCYPHGLQPRRMTPTSNCIILHILLSLSAGKRCLVMKNWLEALWQSETAEYFEWRIMIHILCFSNMVSLRVSLKLGAH